MKQLWKQLIATCLLLVSTITHAGWTVRYQHTDTLGSVIAQSNDQGTISQRFDYKPFGEGTPTQKSGLGYTGHLEDTDLGLTYMQQRYYDPVVGRFYSNDPVGFSADKPMMFNRYAYANNNPYKFTDPSGMSNVAIEIQRTSETNISTAGTINVTSDGSNKTFSGDTLEPPKSPNSDPSTGNGTVRMQSGTYDAEVRGPSSTGNYDKPQLKGSISGEDGKGHTAIQIHAGNNAKDSQGCILVGTGAKTDSVSNSKAALNEVMGVINDTMANDAKTGDTTTITVTIKDINP